jgi:hypothetical protein
MLGAIRPGSLQPISVIFIYSSRAPLCAVYVVHEIYGLFLGSKKDAEFTSRLGFFVISGQARVELVL